MRITRTIIFRAHPLFRLTILSTLLFSALLSNGQFQDDFSDGDFHFNPAWSGDTSDFSISYSSAVPQGQKPALKLNASQAGASGLVVASSLTGPTEWRFWIKISFNTSSSNFARIYLVSDQADLGGPLNGYFIQVGGANDSIGLFRQEGDDIQSLVPGMYSFTGNSTNVMRVKVTCDASGNWNLYADPLGGYNFIQEGSCQDEVLVNSSHFGFLCLYTSSNASKFYFDDFYMNDLYADTLPPGVLIVDVISPSNLAVQFSEEVEMVSAGDSMNYFVDGGIGHPFQVLPDPIDHARVELSFGESFEEDLTYFIEIKNVQDLSGNVMAAQSTGFVFSPIPPIEPAELLIHEIMADVNPVPYGLPEADYIELYNPTLQPVNLLGVSVQPRASSDPLFFPDITLPADGFLIVVNTSDVADFVEFGQVAGLSGFSLNTEGTVVLRNQEGGLIHSIEYNKSWYRDEDKENGGWSLEMMDADNPCSLNLTWMASASPAGGTPGSTNSVKEVVNSAPAIASVVLMDSFTLKVSFSHHMDSVSVTSLSSYFAGEEHGFPGLAEVKEVIFNEVELKFALPFPENGVFGLEIVDTLIDCCGRIYSPGEIFTFVHPGFAGPWDVVINEIMADPDPPAGLPGHEYIELFNASGRFIRVSGWNLAEGTRTWTIPDYIMDPGEYVLLVGSDEALIFSAFARTFLAAGFVLPNSGGSLILENDAGMVISSCTYASSWFSDPTLSEGGFSLEQIDPFNPCSGRDNWVQAKAKEGGTPGSLNSVDAMNIIDPEIEKIIVREDTVLDVYFNSKMDRASLFDPALFFADHGMGNPVAVEVADSLNSLFHLVYSEVFKVGTVYHLSFKNPVRNCIGDEFSIPGAFAFGVAENPSRNDVVINEVLFNPAGGGVDFVEVFNRSEKTINLLTLGIGDVNVDPFGMADTSYKAVTADNWLLLPGDYMVFSTKPDYVREQYECGGEDRFVEMATFPAYNNDRGTVILATAEGEVIDYMLYDAAMHHPLLKNVEGVSLERIHPDRASNDPTNWHSASSSNGFATPALRNSQFMEPGSHGSDLVIEPGIFSPDNDGNDDVVHISYCFPSAGYLASVIIFDVAGRPVRFLVNNELLGTEGSFSWDGITDDRRKAPIGIYVVYFEAFDQHGRIQKNLGTIVLAGQLN